MAIMTVSIALNLTWQRMEVVIYRLVMARFTFAVSQQQAAQLQPAPSLTYRIIIALTAAAAAEDIDKRGFHMAFSVNFSEKPKQTLTVVIPNHLNVSCQKESFCKSSSKHKRGFVCGSNHSHNERMHSCVEYYRLCHGIYHSQREGSQP